MESKHIIIILIAIIVILAAAIGVVLLNPANSKDPSQLTITSEKKQSEGGELSIKLTDLNDTAISKEIVNVTVTNKNGKVVVDDVIKTDSKGKGKLDLDLKKGKYTVNVTYGGNDNYTGSAKTQKLTIKEKETATASASSSSSSSTPSVYAYQSDGTPMYSQAEVDQYMYNKYGLVSYHIKSNRYIDLDEPGFDDAGNFIGY